MFVSNKDNTVVNFCSDLNLTSKLINEQRCVMMAPLVNELKHQNGAGSLGVIATMLDVAASDPVLVAWKPDWTATQDLSIYSSDAVTQGPIVVDAQLLRAGRKVNFISANIYDGHGIADIEELVSAINGTPEKLTPCGSGLITFTRISRTHTEGVDDYDPSQWIGKIRNRNSGRLNDASLERRIGITHIEPGVLKVDSHSYIGNSIGTINGGVQACIAEAAALSLFPQAWCADITIHYLAPLKVGPVITQSTLIRENNQAIVLVELLDQGNNNSPISRATITLEKNENQPLQPVE